MADAARVPGGVRFLWRILATAALAKVLLAAKGDQDMQRIHGAHSDYGEARHGHLVRDVLAVLVVALLVWSLVLQMQVVRLNAKVAKLSAPITVTGYPDRKFTSVNDLALALLHVHQREQGLEASIEEDIHEGGALGVHTHQYIDRKVWAADAGSKDVVRKR